MGVYSVWTAAISLESLLYDMSYRCWHWTAVESFSPCRTQAEMAHTCRGTIPLATAHIEVGETCHLVLTNGGRSYHLKATSEGECQRWVSALQKAKSSATLLMHHSGEVNISDVCQVSCRHISVVRPPDVWHCVILPSEVWRNARGWPMWCNEMGKCACFGGTIAATCLTWSI